MGRGRPHFAERTVRTRRPQAADARETFVPAVAFAPDGKTLVSGGDDGVVRFWGLEGDKPTERSTLRLDKGPVDSINYSPDGNKLVVASGNGSIFLGDSSGKKLREWQLPGPTGGWAATAFASRQTDSTS